MTTKPKAAAPTSAYRDSEGWVLFSWTGEVIEEWPEGWPPVVTGAWLRARGIRTVPDPICENCGQPADRRNS
jgi:hypothetical protein